MNTPWVETINGVDICQTQYGHPDITSGKNANGGMWVFVRVHPDGKWYPARSPRLSKVRQAVKAFGVDYVSALPRRWEGGE